MLYDNNFIFAATLGGGVFSSQSNGFRWKDISIKDIDEYTGNEAIIPVYSLAIIDTNVIASAGQQENFIIHHMMPVLLLTMIIPQMGKSLFSVLLCSNAKLFAGNSAWLYLFIWKQWFEIG